MTSLGLCNWGGNLQYKAHTLHEPRCLAEVQEVARRAGHRLRVIGSRHCFNAIADEEELVSLRHLKGIVEIDAARGRVTVEGGITYGELCPKLQEAGLALHNTASLPHISVVGAVATATHGSGQGNGNLASAVCAMQIVTGLGDVLELDEESSNAELRKAVVGLGCLGIVTRISLKVQPTFSVRQRCFDGLHLRALSSARLDALLGAAYSVSLFTQWKPPAENPADVEFQVWVKQRQGSDEQSTSGALQGCTECSSKQHPLRGMDPSACTDQECTGPWHERLPHFRFEFTPSAGEELQSEYFVPREFAAQGLQALHGVADAFTDLLMVTEVRAIAADDLLLSPHAERHVGAAGSVGYHFTWYKREEEVMSKALPAIEKVLEPFNARPHWGKLFAMSRERLAALYGTALADFKTWARTCDPEGKFCNDWARSTLGF
eukprot:TRINITY_DN13109_c2_g1_i1.p1 TRINITY_DN13109_c2_g1~~TRINITY_DN13109_c2_g1_i1.p1  ORF type:complete len:435 (-),score=119.44 TRINITY_DN13109_c2_g1_i1:67-1371(-)